MPATWPSRSPMAASTRCRAPSPSRSPAGREPRARLNGTAAINGTGNARRQHHHRQLRRQYARRPRRQRHGSAGRRRRQHERRDRQRLLCRAAVAGVTDERCRRPAAQNTGGDAISTTLRVDVENLIGSRLGHRRLSGTPRHNTLERQGGRTTSKGNAGDDIMNGDAGNDTLESTTPTTTRSAAATTPTR